MNRITVIQKIIDKKKAKNYLEIGVQRGRCFLKIKAKNKIAVDPCFQINTTKKIRHLCKNISNRNNVYHEMTSDDFFEMAEDRYDKKYFDVIFIDGLHTYGQTKKDVIAGLEFLSDEGVMVLHDCFPPCEAAAYPSNSKQEAEALNLPGWTGEWCGDVWKTIVHLRSSRDDLDMFVLNCDFGLGILRRGKNKNKLNLSDAEIDTLTYADLEKNKAEYVNLQEPEFITTFVETL